MSRARPAVRLCAPLAKRGTFSRLMAIYDRKEAAPGKVYLTAAEHELLQSVRGASLIPSAAPHWPSIESRQSFVMKMALDARKCGPLIEYLRDGQPVTAEMASLLADLLAGRRKAVPEPARWEDWAKPMHYAGLIRAWEDQFQKADADPELRAFLRFMLRFVYPFGEPYPDSRAAERRAARFIARSMLKLTAAQFDERRFPRRRRKGA